MLKWLDDHIEEVILTILMALTSIIVFLQVIMRFVFRNSLTWSEELARYLFIWLIFIGVSYGIKKEIHLQVDALDALFDRKGQLILDIIVNFFVLILLVLMTTHGSDIVMRATRISGAIEVSMKVVYLAPVVGFALSIIRLIQNTIGKIRQIKSLDKVEEASK